MPGFDPEKDVPDLSGKVILITGGKLPEMPDSDAAPC